MQYRLDLSYPEHLLAIEYDGRWHDAPAQRELDELRRADLRQRGWTVIVLHAEDLYAAPEATLAALRAELEQHGIHVPTLHDEWRRHFAVRELTA